MDSIVKGFDGLNKWVKFILALPMLDIVWNIYRLCRSISKKSVLGIVLAILLIVVGLFFMWIVDMITIVLNNKVLWID